MDAAAELGRNPVSSTIFSVSMEMSKLTRAGLPNPSRETKFSSANADREIYIFSVQLTTSRIGNLTYPVDPYSCYKCDHTYIYNMSVAPAVLRLVVSKPSDVGT